MSSSSSRLIWLGSSDQVRTRSRRTIDSRHLEDFRPGKEWALVAVQRELGSLHRRFRVAATSIDFWADTVPARGPSHEDCWLENEAETCRRLAGERAESRLTTGQRRWLDALESAARAGAFFRDGDEPNLSAASRLLGKNRSSAQRAYAQLASLPTLLHGRCARRHASDHALGAAIGIARVLAARRWLRTTLPSTAAAVARRLAERFRGAFDECHAVTDGDAAAREYSRRDTSQATGSVVAPKPQGRFEARAGVAVSRPLKHGFADAKRCQAEAEHVDFSHQQVAPELGREHLVFTQKTGNGGEVFSLDQRYLTRSSLFLRAAVTGKPPLGQKLGAFGLDHRLAPRGAEADPAEPAGTGLSRN